VKEQDPLHQKGETQIATPKIATQTPQQPDTPNRKPIHEIRLGRIKAAIWQHDANLGPRYNVTVARLYKDDSGWKASDSFGRDDLPVVAKVLDQAHTWIFLKQQEPE
jgi:hypothetical protein